MEKNNLLYIVNAIWNYLKPAWEGDDGHLSYRRSAQFVFLVLICIMVTDNSTQSKWGFLSFLVLCLTFLLLAMVITADQILKGVNGLTSITSTVTQEKDESIPDVTKTTTTVETSTQPAVKVEGQESG